MFSYRVHLFLLLSFILLYYTISSTSPQLNYQPILSQQSPNHNHHYTIFDNATINKTSSLMILNLQSYHVNLLNLPDVRQSTSYTCGPSSLQAVLSYYRYDFRQHQLAQIAKTTQDGTTPYNMVQAVRLLGLKAQIKQNMTIKDLQQYILNRQPVIVAFQAWRQQDIEYDNDWIDGHYAVVIGFDQMGLYFEDPSILGSIGYISKNEFEQRWHDQGDDGKKWYGMGIIIKDVMRSRPVVIKLE